MNEALRLSKKTMNQSQQALLSRLVDGDLSPGETAEIKALLATDAEAQLLFQEYMATSFAVASLPRPAIPLDMTERIRPLLARRQWPIFSDWVGGANPWWAVGASVFVVAVVSSGVFISLKESGKVSGNQVRKITAVTVGDARNDEALAKVDEESQPESPKVDLQVASRASKVFDGPPSVKSGQAGAEVTARPLALSPIDQFHDGLKVVDRRHVIRIHVPATNSKVEDQVLGALSQFHHQESRILKTTESSDEAGTPSLIYLGFVPTSLYEELILNLEAKFPKGLERVSTDEFAKIQDQQTNKVMVVDEATLARVKALEAGMKKDELERPEKSRLKLGPDRAEVGDAIAQPLEELSGGSPIRSLDGVMIVIRSDLSADEPTKNESTKARKRGVLKDPK
jgi:hypothetical protein